MFKSAHKLIQPVEAFLDVRQACGVADAQIVVRTERDSRDRSHFLLLEEARA